MRITDSWLAALFGIGLAPGEITPLQMAARAVAIYLLALLCIRAVDKRFLVRNSPFDVLVTVILGSTLSRTITGQAAFWPALVASAALIAAHWAFNALSFHSRLLAILLKGQPFVIVKDGQPIWENMETLNFSKADLEQKLREHGDLTIDDVELAILERSGKLSVIRKT